MPTARAEHLPVRPCWNCGTCGKPWPCAPARDQLRADFRGFPTTLTVYLAAQYNTALDDCLTAPADVPEDFYARFLSWTRPGSS